MAYGVEFSDVATKELKKIDASIRRRSLKKIKWLSENFESTTHLKLTGDLAGLFKLRVGDYRVVYSFDDEIAIITIERVGHRRDIYKQGFDR
ncbi:MAG: type II toxin-antitoxin system RelE/ParE family toxin [Phormidesmis sp.]